MSHSLGARIVMETIKRLPPERCPVVQVCVMAAAIDDFSLTAIKAYRGATQLAQRVAVLSSAKDTVLRWAYPAGDILQSFLFFWKDIGGLALGYHGPRETDGLEIPVNVLHVPIDKAAGTNHGDYIYAGKPKPNHLAAGRFANAVIAGDPAPAYRL